jgi:hypothetical protein
MSQALRSRRSKYTAPFSPGVRAFEADFLVMKQLLFDKLTGTRYASFMEKSFRYYGPHGNRP